MGIDSEKESSTRSIEEVARESNCETVTIARLAEAPNVVVSMIPFTDRLEGPFHVYVDSNEELRHIFHNSNLYFEGGTDPFGDRHGVLKHRIYPTTLLITSKRIILIYKNGENRRVIITRYDEITQVKRTLVNHGLKLWTESSTFKIHWGEIGYEGAEKPSLEYVVSKIKEYSDSEDVWSDNSDFEDIGSILKDQLYKIKNIAMKADLEYVAGYAVKGALTGARKGQYGAIVGFILGGGYGLWKDLSNRVDGKSSAYNLDPKQTARTVVRWRQAGRQVGGRETGLAGAVIGAAISIDSQSTGRKVTTILANSDIEWVTRQLEDSSNNQLVLEVPTDMIDQYSTQMAELLNDDFFESLEEK